VPIVAAAVMAEKATVEPITAALMAIDRRAMIRAALIGRWFSPSLLNVLLKGNTPSLAMA
jgi:hypothetical protein